MSQVFSARFLVSLAPFCPVYLLRPRHPFAALSRSVGCLSILGQGDPPAGCKRHSLLHLALTGARLDRFPVPSEPAGGFAPKLKYTPECVIC